MKKMGRGNSLRTTLLSKSGKDTTPAAFMTQMVTTAAAVCREGREGKGGHDSEGGIAASDKPRGQGRLPADGAPVPTPYVFTNQHGPAQIYFPALRMQTCKHASGLKHPASSATQPRKPVGDAATS
jgi:hypothetical protein